MPFATIFVFISILDGNTGGIFAAGIWGYCLPALWQSAVFGAKVGSEVYFAAAGQSLRGLP
jgi:hypothetical protein